MSVKSKKPLLLTLNLEHCLPGTLIGLLKDRFTDGLILDKIAKFHARNEILMEMLLTHPRVMPQTLLHLFNLASADFKKRISERLKKAPPASLEKGLVPVKGLNEGQASSENVAHAEHQTLEQETLYQRVQHLTVAEKVQFALRAGKDARSLLLKDPNRQVAQAVLASPKITEDEILLIAQSKNVSDDILRTVGKNKEWLKNYAVILSLVSNPKTPLGISMPLLTSIRVKDLGIISKNRNVPEAIRSGASRLLSAKQKQS
ncbi:MAG: hypothetical protein HY283_01125 [Nitrospirae bacterium]|nr:hypothetical protein [Nitrospirota bacterium]